MVIAKIEVNRADARKIYCGTLTSGMVGAEVIFSFDPAWDGLHRIVIFKAGCIAKDVLLTNDRAEIPHEVLKNPCPRLTVGIYGTKDDGTLVIPTVWAELGYVHKGSKPSGDASAKPTPEVWAQILGMIGDLKDLNTEEKKNLVAAINEVLRNGADPKEIQRLVEEYLKGRDFGGIHVGPEAPEDPNVDIWVDTDEEGSVFGCGIHVGAEQPDDSSVSFWLDTDEGEDHDFIPNPEGASPGQVMKVAAVDENGVPSKWELAELPQKPGDVGALPLPQGGKVGQYFRISAVDETGTVTAVEAVDAPAAAGGESWELIADVTTDEDVADIRVDRDLDGNAFAIVDVEFKCHIPIAAARDDVTFHTAFSSIGGVTFGPAMTTTTAVTTYGWVRTTKQAIADNASTGVICACNTIGYYAENCSGASVVKKFFVRPKNTENVLPAGTRLQIWGKRV